MKPISCYLFIFLLSNSLFAQQFGSSVTAEGALDASNIDAKMTDPSTKNVKVMGTIQEVCQVKGCWMTMDVGNQQSMRITFKDYGFFVPPESSGRTAILQGQLKTETIDVPTLRHFAKDAGKSEQEIAAISQPKVELTFVADGVLLLE